MTDRLNKMCRSTPDVASGKGTIQLELTIKLSLVREVQAWQSR